jgi:streptomycin 6-kinase
MIRIPDPAEPRVRHGHGDSITAWLREIPRLKRECEDRWGIDIGPPFPSGPLTHVAPATRRTGERIVLKLVFPDDDSAANEARALEWYDGHGAVRLLDADPPAGILLLESADPDYALTRTVEQASDDEATLSAAGVMGRLWATTDSSRPMPPLPTIADDLMVLTETRTSPAASANALEPKLVSRAERIAAELLQSAPPDVVLHGDLHHQNILRGVRTPWLAIDPKGRRGEPACETAALLRNPLPSLLATPQLATKLGRRIAILTEVVQIDRSRILAWAFTLTVAAACWQLEDHGAGFEPWIHVARAFASLMRSN